MMRISALALTFAFMLSPLLAVLCEVQCVAAISVAIAPAGGCHSAEVGDRLSLESDRSTCSHDVGVASLAAMSSRVAQDRIAQASGALPIAPRALHETAMVWHKYASPPGTTSDPSLSARHRILRV